MISKDNSENRDQSPLKKPKFHLVVNHLDNTYEHYLTYDGVYKEQACIWHFLLTLSCAGVESILASTISSHHGWSDKSRENVNC